MRTRTIIALLLAVSAIAAGAVYGLLGSKPRVSMGGLVVRALSRDANVSYVAQVATTTEYYGKTIHTHAAVFHRGGTEKVVSTDARGRSTWSMTSEGKSYTYLPEENKLLVSETGKLLSDADWKALLLRNYRAVSEGTDKVAGRDTYVVDISSRHDGRPSKKLWIDKEHLTILKSIDYSASGDERGRTVTEQIRYGARIPPERFALPTDGSVSSVAICEPAQSTDLSKALGIQVHRPSYLPAGYELEGCHVFHCQCSCDHRCAQLTYTDGLNVLSVFQTPKMTSCKDGACNMTSGCENSQGCALANCGVARTGSITKSDRTVVVVGDLLPKDVRKIAESVR